ncbi:MAG: N-6 DNA methylase [Phycisphaerales bacterium]|nr:N-6 DNA methylase [Phycisphaerales bacterium]
MAKKAKDSGQPLLVPEFRRRHLHLVLPKLLTEKATSFPFDDARLKNGLSVLQRWADLAAQGALQQKETSLDAEFLRVILGQALGYKTRTDSPDAYNMERQFTVPGAGMADGALGSFATGREAVPSVIIECKDATTDLDHDKFDGRTPVQQLWDYLAQLPDTPWGILTNYLAVRLYHRDSPMRAYQEFKVADFRSPAKVREFLYLFEPEGLLGSVLLQRPRALDLLNNTQDLRLTVGDKLYDYYSNQRAALIDALIIEQNYSTDDAIHAAQRLLDRVIFIAFCEDRGLLPAKLLENTWAKVAPLSRAGARWRNFLDMFHAINKGHDSLDLPTGYNGGLFKHDPLVDELKLDDERWTQVFKNIGDYDFRDEGEINVDVLGHIFEKSITELEKLRVLGLFGKQAGPTGEPAMPKSAMRKRFGIYYTPPQFTQFIVEKTIGQLIAERIDPLGEVEARVAALRKLKVVDPACGSGAFLIAAYDCLEEAYDVVLHLLRVQGRLDEAMRIERNYPDWILADNLFGVDLSQESVEITQLALWIRSARKGTTLSDLSQNIICGNSLVTDPSVHARAMEWKAMFPEVFKAGGFDCVIGNPPWERLKLQEREFFSLSSPKIASAVNAADRRKLIERVEKENPDLWTRYHTAKGAAEKTLSHVRGCGQFPFTGRGDVNTYMLFAELSRQLVEPDGLIGLLVPSGIATDDTTKHFFGDLMEKKAISALYDFENKEGVFADVHRAFKFSVLLMNGRDRQTDDADFVFFARSIEDLKPRDRHIRLTARDLKLLNPNTRTCPIFRTRRDCEMTKRIYRNIPVLVDESRKTGGNPWAIKFVTMFHQTNDAEHFRTAQSLKDDGFRLEGNRWLRRKEIYLPLYEAKMIQAFDHRAASVVVEGANWMRQGQTEETTPVMHKNPEFVAMPRFWVVEKEVADVLDGKGSSLPGFIGFKDITSPTNQRTMIASAIPYSAVTNHFPLMLMKASCRRQLCLLGNLNSFAFDYATRQKIGGITLNFFIVEQLPTLPPDRYEEKCPWDKKQTLEKWIGERVLKLTCTANDMRPLAEAAGFKEGIHKWNEAERQRLRAELDAAYFHLYGLAREEVDYVLDQFQGVVKQDEAHGRPGPMRNAILEAYDAQQA